MLVVALAALGVAAEGKSLEDIASPLSAVKNVASRGTATSIPRAAKPQGAGT